MINKPEHDNQPEVVETATNEAEQAPQAEIVEDQEALALKLKYTEKDKQIDKDDLNEISLTKGLLKETQDPEVVSAVVGQLASYLETVIKANEKKLTHEMANIVDRTAAFDKIIEEEKNRLERVKRDNDNAKLYANEKLIKNAVKPLFRDLATAITALPKGVDNPDFDQFRSKLELLANQFKTDLTKFGLEVYGQEGDKFDPNLHEAVAQYPAPTPEQSETIACVVAQGYKLHGRVIEAANIIAYM